MLGEPARAGGFVGWLEAVQRAGGVELSASEALARLHHLVTWTIVLLMYRAIHSISGERMLFLWLPAGNA
eukprot:g7954.t1